jgi:cholesterol transport system auxiliary component
MSFALRRITRALLVLAGISILVACAPTRPNLETSTWLIDPKRTGEPRKPNTDFWLKVGPVSVNAPFDGKSMVYRLADQRYEKDFYNGYISTPAEMVGNGTRQWISDANIFKAAVNQSNTFFPYYTLQVNVTEFYGDYRNQAEAVVSIEFYLAVLSSGSQNPIVMNSRYTQRVPLKDNRPGTLANGLQQAFATILQRFEADLDAGTKSLPKPLVQPKPTNK